MWAKREVTIRNLDKVPLEEVALSKLIRKFYKGSNNIELNFDSRISCLGQHRFLYKERTHLITISPLLCSIEDSADSQPLSDEDVACRILVTILHELKHAMQCDKDPAIYQFTNADNPHIKNRSLSYSLSLLEAEAEGWALLRFNKALEFYKECLNATRQVS